MIVIGIMSRTFLKQTIFLWHNNGDNTCYFYEKQGLLFKDTNCHLCAYCIINYNICLLSCGRTQLFAI